MALVYTPDDFLVFNVNTKGVTETEMQLSNENTSKVSYKIKTTAPRNYCVRPNSGWIEPNSSVKIQIGLQALKDGFSFDQLTKDKFLVQSVALTEDLVNLSQNELWPAVERAAKETISQKKLRVRFITSEQADSAPKDTSSAPNPNILGTGEANSTASAAGVKSSTPSVASATSAPHTPLNQPLQPMNTLAADTGASGGYVSAIGGSNAANLESAISASDSVARPPPQINAPVERPAHEGAGLAAEPVANQSAQASITELNFALMEAKRTIESLKSQLKAATETSARKDAVRPSLPNNISPQSLKSGDIGGLSLSSVSIIAFISFLIGYLMF